MVSDGTVASAPNITMDDSVLTINPVEAAVFADYYCRVQNSQGWAISDTATLTEYQMNTLDLTVMLDGPYNGADMNTSLHDQYRYRNPM